MKLPLHLELECLTIDIVQDNALTHCSSAGSRDCFDGSNGKLSAPAVLQRSSSFKSMNDDWLRLPPPRPVRRAGRLANPRSWTRWDSAPPSLSHEKRDKAPSMISPSRRGRGHVAFRQSKMPEDVARERLQRSNSVLHFFSKTDRAGPGQS